MFLHGIFPPITTPFYPDGSIYHRKLEQNVPAFERALRAAAADYAKATGLTLSPEDGLELMAAKLVGRWRDGIALELDPHRLRKLQAEGRALGNLAKKLSGHVLSCACHLSGRPTVAAPRPGCVGIHVVRRHERGARIRGLSAGILAAIDGAHDSTRYRSDAARSQSPRAQPQIGLAPAPARGTTGPAVVSERGRSTRCARPVRYVRRSIRASCAASAYGCAARTRPVTPGARATPAA